LYFSVWFGNGSAIKTGRFMKMLYQKGLPGFIALLIILFSSPATWAAPPDSFVQLPALSAGNAAQGVSVSETKETGLAAADRKAEVNPHLWQAPSRGMVYTVIGVVLSGSFIALLFIRASLIDLNWKLADALSEDVEISLVTTNAEGKEEVKLDASNKPTMVTVMSASVSRLIAFMGMMVILFMFLGFGIFAMYSFAFTGEMPASTDMVIKFLAGGMTLFAPYLVNQFSKIFESISPKAR
jgi:hypothetical protein